MAKFAIYKTKGAVRFSHNIGNKGPITLVESALSAGERKYDWENKVTFSLTVTEMASLMMHLSDPSKPVKFTHDPGIGTDKASKAIKVMSVSTVANDKGGQSTFVQLEQKSTESKISVPLSESEARVLYIFLNNAIIGHLGFGVDEPTYKSNKTEEPVMGLGEE
jgi:hypothetical protein